MHVGGATHTHTIGPTCDLSGPRANQRAHVRVIGPRCALMGSRIGPVGMFLPHDETTTFNTDVPALAKRKVPTNQHVLSVLIVGANQLKQLLFRTIKPKSHHKTNTICPITRPLTLNPFEPDPHQRLGQHENPRASLEARGSCAETAGFEPARGYAPLPP